MSQNMFCFLPRVYVYELQSHLDIAVRSKQFIHPQNDEALFISSFGKVEIKKKKKLVCSEINEKKKWASGWAGNEAIENYTYIKCCYLKTSL